NGPKIIAGTPTGTNNLPDPNRKVRVTFNEPVNPATFIPAEVFVRSTSRGNIVVSAVTPVAGSNNTQFDITFPQITTGDYTVLIGPDIQEFAGHKMDQNGNFIDGELPDDMYVLQFGVQGLRVTASSLNGTAGPTTQPGQAYIVHLTFNESILLSSLTTAAVSLSGPDGTHTAFGVVPTLNTNFTQFDVLFAPLTAAGTYTVTVRPTIADVYGNLLDQDGNRIPGQSTDAYSNVFTVTGPTVASVVVAPGRPIDHVTVTFNQPMDPATFSTGSFSLTAPGGAALAITAVAAVPFTNDTQFEVDFSPSSATGVYTLTVHAGVADVYGNALANDVTRTFSVQVTYTAS